MQKAADVGKGPDRAILFLQFFEVLLRGGLRPAFIGAGELLRGILLFPCPPLRHLQLQLETAVGELGRRDVEAKLEASKLQVGHLMGGDYFEPGEIILLVGVVVHHRRQEYLGAIGGSGVFVHPPDILADQLLGVEDFDGRAGEGTAVQPDDPFYPVQFQT